MTKVLIFTSYGGGGHISASNAIADYLKESYEVTIVPIFATPFKQLDPVRFITFKKYNAEDAYNYFLRKRWIRLLNLTCTLALKSVPFITNTLEKVLIDHIKKHNPDLIISVIPIVNNVVAQAAKQCNIPFLIIPTDLDTTTFIKGLTIKEHDDFFIGFAFDDPDLLQIANNVKIPRSKVGITGFPLRRSFFEPKNKQAIKEHFSIPSNKPVILLLMGAVGSQAIYRYVKAMATIDMSFHLIVCLGRNEGLRKRIEAIPLKSTASLSIFGFTEHIADLMAVSDFCIAKPGSVSVCEAIYMNLPLILDATSKSLLWENFNLLFIQRHSFGNIVKKNNQIQSMIVKYLKDPSYVAELKTNLKAFRKERFNNHIKSLVETMLKRDM